MVAYWPESLMSLLGSLAGDVGTGRPRRLSSIESDILFPGVLQATKEMRAREVVVLKYS
jgi:hypothetical protein